MRLDFTLEVPRPRFVVVHYHFFKNAGSTIESILEREFGGEFATLHGLTADLCFIRHPLDRLQSMYSYLRKANTAGALCQMPCRCSAAQFLRNLLDQSPHLVSNVQVIYAPSWER